VNISYSEVSKLPCYKAFLLIKTYEEIQKEKEKKLKEIKLNNRR
jgi:hypothetical protein